MCTGGNKFCARASSTIKCICILVSIGSLRTCCAANSSIFRVSTIVNSSVGTVYQSAFCVSTSEVIQEDVDSPLAIESIAIGNCI